MHSEGTPHPGGRHEGNYGERAETYACGPAGPARPAWPGARLADVWACGLAVLSGHLVVAVAEPGYPRAQVLALPAPDAEPIAITVRAAGDDPAGLPTWQVVP